MLILPFRAVRIVPFLFILVVVVACGGGDSSSSADVVADTLSDVATVPDAVADTTFSEDTATVADTAQPLDTGAVDTATVPDTAKPVDTATSPDTAIGPAPDPGESGAYAFAASSAQLGSGGGAFGADATTLTVLTPEGKNLPVVLMLPGFQLNPSDYTSTREHLASHGFYVVSPSFPGSLFEPKNNVELRDITLTILDWIETQAAGPLSGVIDPSKLAAVGHSLGGKIGLLTASGDARIDAILGIDPVDSGPPFAFDPAEYPSVTPELMGQIQVPLLLMGETTNGSGGSTGQACAPADNNFQEYYKAAASPAMEVDVLGANHMSFLDNPNCLVCFACPSGSDDPATTRLITRRLAVAFLTQQLLADNTYDSWLTGADLQTMVSDGLIQVAGKNGF